MWLGVSVLFGRDPLGLLEKSLANCPNYNSKFLIEMTYLYRRPSVLYMYSRRRDIDEEGDEVVVVAC